MTRATMQMAQDYLERIKELEKENTELRNNGFTVSAMTEQQLKVAIEKGEQLEKENAELKKRVDNLYNSDCWASDQLAKAKEIIGNLYEMIKRPYKFTAPRKIQMVSEAEQFLKDIKEG